MGCGWCLGCFRARGVYCGCFILLVCVRLSLCGGARRQSRAMYVACTKCVQVSVSETCRNVHPSCRKMDNVSTLPIFLQLGCTQYKTQEFLRQHLQLGSVARKRATLLRCTARTCTELARSLHGACTQTVKFCTNLHTLFFLAFKLKRSIPTPI